MDRPTARVSKRTQRGKRAQRLWRVSRWLILALAALAVTGWVYFRLDGRKRALGLVNRALTGVLVGRVEVERVESVSLWGASGIDARLFDPEGRVVATVDDVSARISVLSLVKQLLFDDGSLAIEVDEVDVASAELRLYPDADGQPSFLRAVAVTPSEPSTSRDQGTTTLALHRVTLGRAWLFGKAYGLAPIDSSLDDVRVDVDVGAEDLVVDVESAEWTVRALPSLGEAHGQLGGKLRYADPSGQAALADAIADLHLELEGESGDRSLEVRADKKGHDLDVHVEVDGLLRRDLAALGVPWSPDEPVRLVLDGQGALEGLEFRGRGESGPSDVDVTGHLTLLPSPALSAHVEVAELELRQFVDGLGPSPIDASFDLNLRREGTAWVGRLDGQTAATRLSGQHLPPLGLSAALAPRTLHLEAHSRERGADTALRIDGPNPTATGLGSTYDFELHSTLADVRRIVGPLKIGGTGRLHAQGRFDGARSNVDATADAQLFDLGADEASLERLNLRARVEGPLADPKLDVSAWGENAVLSGRRFREVKLTSRGRWSASRLEAELSADDGAITVRSAVSATRGLAGSALDVDFRKNGTHLHIVAKRLVVDGGRVEFDDLRMNGAGTLTASGYFSPTALRLVGSARDLELQPLADAAQVEGYVYGGSVDFDADFTLDINHSAGRLSVRMKELLLPHPEAATAEKTPRNEKLDFTLDAIGDGPQMFVALDGQSRTRARRDGTRSATVAGNAELMLGLGRLHSLFDGKRWLDSALSLKLAGDIDLARASQFLPADLPATADGNAHVELVAQRVRQAAPPNIDLSVVTQALVVRFSEEDPRANRAPRGIDDVDATMHFSHRPTTNESELAVALTYQTQPLLDFEISLEAPLERLFGAPLATLRAAPFTAELDLPRRRIASFPGVLNLPQLRGEVAAQLEAHGTSLSPVVKLRANVFDFSDDVRDKNPIEGELALDYAEDRLRISAHGETRGKKRIAAEVKGTSSASDLAAGKLPSDVELDLDIHQLPIGLWPAANDAGLRGSLDGRVQGKGLGGPSPKLQAEVDFAKLRLWKQRLTRGILRAELDARALKGELHVAAEDWTVDGAGDTELTFDSPWAPALGEHQHGDLAARRFRLSWLMPLLSSVVADLDGRVDANFHAEQAAGRTAIEGHARLEDGRLQLPALGQQLMDVEASLDWPKDGHVTLHDASFRGISGRGHLEGRADFEGISPRRADLDLNIDREERLPLSLEGFGLGDIYGHVQVHADVDSTAKKVLVRSHVENFALRMQEIPTADVQSLDADEHIDVGVHLGRERFVTLPLQPIEDAAVEDAHPWTLELTVSLDHDVWVQQGPTRRIQLGGSIHVAMARELQLTGQLSLSRGRIELNGRRFDVEEGTITFQPDDPANPIIVVEASWTAPDGTVVFARFVGPVDSGKLTLRSEPALSQGEILSLVLFGTTDGLNNVGSGGGGSSGASQASQAVAVGGGVATQGLNQALSRLDAVDVSTRIDSDDSGNARPEVVVQLSSSLSAQLGYNLVPPVPGKSPDRTLLTLELRLVAGHSLATTVGDKGTGIVDWTWRFRY